MSAFKKLPAFPQQEAARLCYLLLMQGLPAVAEANLDKFGAVITQLQRAVGEHFAIAQGGVFTSTEVATSMAWLEQQGAVAIGQTSWGPTGFCAVGSPEQASELIAQLEQRFADFKNLSFVAVSAKNSGGEVVVLKNQ
jgi:predicted sugar kinase